MRGAVRRVALLAFLGAICVPGGVVGAPAVDELQKPAPPSAHWDPEERLRSVIEGLYCGTPTESSDTTPLLTVLFNPDGSVSHCYMESLPHDHEAPAATEFQFARFELAPGEIQSIGVAKVAVSGGVVTVVWGIRNASNLDRRLVERYLPDSLKAGAGPDEQMGILFDHQAALF